MTPPLPDPMTRETLKAALNITNQDGFSLIQEYWLERQLDALWPLIEPLVQERDEFKTLADTIAALTAERDAALRAQLTQAWRPIETAPSVNQCIYEVFRTRESDGWQLVGAGCTGV